MDGDESKWGVDALAVFRGVGEGGGLSGGQQATVYFQNGSRGASFKLPLPPWKRGIEGEGEGDNFFHGFPLGMEIQYRGIAVSAVHAQAGCLPDKHWML